MAIDVLIDFETLSTDPRAALLSMGIVALDATDINPEDYNASFDKLVASGLHIKFHVANQQSKYNRVISEDTVAWWAGQGDSASAVLAPMESDVDLSELPGIINAFLKHHNVNGKCYTRGMIDATWLQSLTETLHSDIDIKWWNYRDVRTVIDTLTGSTNGYLPRKYTVRPTNLIKHNALHDCCLDAIQMHAAFMLA